MNEVKKINIIINEELEEKRVDIALSLATELSRSMIQKLIYANNVKCNGELVLKPNFITKIDQNYEIIELASNIDSIVEEKGEIEILFEDEHIIVINKQAGIVVHPGAGNWNGTMINHLSYYLSQSKESLSDYNMKDYEGNLRLGVVHRLDKDVSGCIVMAKTNQAHMALGLQFQERVIKKEYIALCYGKCAQNVKSGQEWEGLAEDYIGRSTFDRKKMMCVPQMHAKDKENLPVNKYSGKYSTMHYKIQACKYIDPKTGFISRVQCFPETGRMHQIRLQLAQRKLPIIGDTLYGNKQNKTLTDILGPRIALHAHAISFVHPITNKDMNIVAPVPESFDAIMGDN